MHKHVEKSKSEGLAVFRYSSAVNQVIEPFTGSMSFWLRERTNHGFSKEQNEFNEEKFENV